MQCSMALSCNIVDHVSHVVPMACYKQPQVLMDSILMDSHGFSYDVMDSHGFSYDVMDSHGFSHDVTNSHKFINSHMTS